ncbi:ABC-2 family transporter protein [Candidatus Microgenomates bacterium]|nr:ABC-2 family transporter protein [Candidatus Microgenomates bacterium]
MLLNSLRKYYQVFVVSISEMFVWKLNFVLWRVRVVLQILLLYFLWSTVFLQQEVVFGYERAQILTYIISVAFLRSLVLSSRSVGDVAGDIRDGELTNFLLRPLSYIGWWWARDAADKVLNIAFALVELSLLWFLFQPPLILQSNIVLVLATLAASLLALILYFYFSFLLSMAAFWVAEAWGIRFLAMMTLEFLAGGFFPLDILPSTVFRALQLTPFPYMLFFPAKIYLGQLGFNEILMGFGVLVLWTVFFMWAVQAVWMRGLRTYGAEGR